ncbi:hypothetical protein [Glycocaulis sp.]|uniref:hypothetical protein n=1 Tax=Glycocaulis sp. TaxID=1969725 RepID=UPI003D204F19
MKMKTTLSSTSVHLHENDKIHIYSSQIFIYGDSIVSKGRSILHIEEFILSEVFIGFQKFVADQQYEVELSYFGVGANSALSARRVEGNIALQSKNELMLMTEREAFELIKLFWFRDPVSSELDKLGVSLIPNVEGLSLFGDDQVRISRIPQD